MKTRLLRLIACAAIAFGITSTAFAQGTGFTYQGRLNDGSGPANGTYDLTFTLHSAVSGATQVGGLVTKSSTPVSNGLFTVSLDFGNQFPGANRWLEIGVRTNGAGGFTTLTPRQPITATPYAVYAPNAGTAVNASSVAASGIMGTIQAGNIGAGSITSTMLANGAGTTGVIADGAVTAAKVASVTNWFPLTIANPTPAAIDNFGISVAAVGSDRVLIGARDDNTGAVDAGAAYLFSTDGTLLTTYTNPTPAFRDSFGCSVAALGSDRVLIGAYGDLGGAGVGAAYLFSTNGTLLTTITNPTPGDGDHFGSSVAAVGSDRVLIAAYRAPAGSGVGAAYLFSTNGTLLTTFTNPTPANGDWFGTSVAAVGSDRVLISATGDSGGTAVGAVYLFSTNGSLLTTITNPTPALTDWFGTSVAAVGSDRLLIGARYDDTGATRAGAAYLFSTNGTLLTTFTSPTPAEFDHFGFSVAAVGSDRVLIGAYGVSGGTMVGAVYLFSTNGSLITTFANPTPANGDQFGYAMAAVGNNRVLIGAFGDDTGAVNAGAAYLFSIESFASGVVADAVRPIGVTTASLQDGAVTLSKLAPAIGVWTRAVNSDTVFRLDGSVGIGKNNPATALDVNGTVTATGFSGTGAGLTGLSAANVSSGTLPDARLSANVALRMGGNTFNGSQVVTNGSVGIGTNAPETALHVVGTVTCIDIRTSSDRNLKENFAPVSSRDVLEKVAGLSISRWNFKGDTATPHVGPMAQDFHAAFGLGTDDRHIATVDADGVALAAIQGLNQKVEEKNAEIADLKARLEKLERMLEAKGGAR